MAEISRPLKIFLWACAILWMGSGVLSFFFFDRYSGMLLIFSFLMLVGLFGVAAAVLWALKRILAFFHPGAQIDAQVLNKEIEIGSTLKSFFAGAQGREKPQGTLVLSSKEEPIPPDIKHPESAIHHPVNKRQNTKKSALPLSAKVIDFLSEPAEKGRMTNLQTLLLLSCLLCAYIALILHLAGSWTNAVAVGKFILAIGLPILLLSLFKTGRKILTVLLYSLRVFLIIFDILSLFGGGRSGRSSGGGFSGGGGGFGGGGASGKW
jgi:hypothetical protein